MPPKPSNDAAVTTVRSAASRAGVAQAAKTGARSAQPLPVSHVRKLALGGEVVKLSRGLAGAEMSKLLAEIRADAALEYVQVDRMMQALGNMPASAAAATAIVAAGKRLAPQRVPTDPLYAGYQWNLFNPAGGINAPAAWDVSTAAGTVLAVIDTASCPPTLIWPALRMCLQVTSSSAMPSSRAGPMMAAFPVQRQRPGRRGRQREAVQLRCYGGQGAELHHPGRQRQCLDVRELRGRTHVDQLRCQVHPYRQQ